MRRWPYITRPAPPSGDGESTTPAATTGRARHRDTQRQKHCHAVSLFHWFIDSSIFGTLLHGSWYHDLWSHVHRCIDFWYPDATALVSWLSGYPLIWLSGYLVFSSSDFLITNRDTCNLKWMNNGKIKNSLCKIATKNWIGNAVMTICSKKSKTV